MQFKQCLIEVTSVADDTNIWVSSALTARKESKSDTMPKQEVERKIRGMKKMQALLAMLQHVFVPVPGEPGFEVWQLHAPCQLLPRANWCTVNSRMRRWSVFCSEGCGEQFGGQELWSEFCKVKYKLIVCCADALGTNHVVQASEQVSWESKRKDGCPQAATTFQIESDCMAHQACLAKKPGLLAIEGLCSAVVRFTRAMRSSKYQNNFNQTLDRLAAVVDRRCVAELPPNVRQWREQHKILCEMLGHTLAHDESNIAYIIDMFNGDWSVTYESSGEWIHFCHGCCSSKEDCVGRAREAFRLLFQNYPPIPLLYRWKGWEQASDYIALGVFVHGFLQTLVKTCCAKTSVSAVSELEDEDAADLSFALRQEVRLAKSLAFVTSDSIHESMI